MPAPGTSPCSSLHMVFRDEPLLRVAMPAAGDVRLEAGDQRHHVVRHFSPCATSRYSPPASAAPSRGPFRPATSTLRPRRGASRADPRPADRSGGTTETTHRMSSGEAMLFRWDGPESGVTALLGGPTVVTAGLENWPATIEPACIGTSISASINGRAAIDAVDAIYASGEFAFGLSPFSGNSSIVAGKFHNLVLRQLCVLVVGPPQQERRCLD